MDSLHIGGGEKSLVTLLNIFDYSRYNVDLQLFGYGGAFEKYLPREVNLLPRLRILKKLSQPLYKQFLFPGIIISRLKFAFYRRIRKQNYASKAPMYWKNFGKYFEQNWKSYHIAIAYSQGISTFYVADKINAKKKVSWINVSMFFCGENKNYYRKYYEKLNKIVTVSPTVYSIFANKTFPEINSKFLLIRDIIDKDMILRMASLENPFYVKDKVNIMTVGRLDKIKGYDLVIQAAEILKERKIKFIWTIIGEGTERMNMERLIRKLGWKTILSS